MYSTRSLKENNNRNTSTPQYFTISDETGEETICPPFTTPDVPKKSNLASSSYSLTAVSSPNAKAKKTSRKPGKKSNHKERDEAYKIFRAHEDLKKQMDTLKKEFAQFANEVQGRENESKEATNSDGLDNKEDDEDSFDIFSILRWVKNLMSYRLYKSNDIIQMRMELQKHKALCEEMCQKTRFWKGKICHFLQTGQQDWRISDKYFVNLGNENNCQLDN